MKLDTPPIKYLVLSPCSLINSAVKFFLSFSLLFTKTLTNSSILYLSGSHLIKASSPIFFFIFSGIVLQLLSILLECSSVINVFSSSLSGILPLISLIKFFIPSPRKLISLNSIRLFEFSLLQYL